MLNYNDLNEAPRSHSKFFTPNLYDGEGVPKEEVHDIAQTTSLMIETTFST